MCLRRRRLLSGLILFFSFLAFQAQTLYWVGGSGNFNDPNHWSLTSGGSFGNHIPNTNNDVVIDENSGALLIDIHFNESASFRSLNVRNYSIPVRFTGNSGRLNISGSFHLSPFSVFEYKGQMNFKSQLSGYADVVFESSLIDADLSFGTGKYNFVGFKQKSGHSVKFAEGTYKFSKSYLNTDELYISGANTKLMLDTSYFMINKKVHIPDPIKVESRSFGFYAPFGDGAAVTIHPAVNFGPQSKLGSSNINSICEASVYAYPSCPGTCQGVFSVVIDPACVGSTLDLIVNNASCGTTAASLSANSVTNTFVVNNVCACSSANFNIVIVDNNFIPIPVTIFVGSTGSGNFNFQQPSTNLLTLNTKLPSCFASCDGSLALSITGGNAPYNVSVSGPVVSSFTSAGGFPFTSLCGGVYNFTLTDKYNCITNASKSLIPPTLLLPNPITRSVTCFGLANGGYSISPTGGTPNYTVNFSPGGTFTTGTAPSTISLNGLPQSAISVTITDSKGCTTTTNTSILQPTDFTVATSKVDISCGGSCIGIGSTTVTGVSGGTGAGSYSYSWSPATGNAASNNSLCVGLNTITITDNVHGCVTTRTFNILQVPPIVISSNSTNIVCNGFSTGAISATVTGGTPTFVATWVSAATGTLQTSVINSTVSISNLPAGNYTLFIRDANSCTNSATYVLTESSPVSLTVTSVLDNNCPGALLGAATLSASGGNGAPYTYTWVAGNTATATALAAGIYTAISADNSGCLAPAVSFTIKEPPTFTIATNIQDVLCFQGTTGAVTVTPTGGTGTYSYTLLSFAGTFTNTTGIFANLSVNGTVQASTYTILVADANVPPNCPQSSTFSVAQPTSIPDPAIIPVNASCFNICNAQLTGTVTNAGGTSPYTYNWLTPAGNVNNQQILTNQCVGNYTLNVVDANGCPAPQVTITITEPSSVTVVPNTTSISCTIGQGPINDGAISLVVIGGNAPYIYSWTGPAAFSSTNQNISSLASGEYTLNFTANSCTQAPITVSVAAATAITLTQTEIPSSCAALCDGTVIATVTSGGRAPFNFVFTGASVVANTNGTFTGVCGPYTVVVTDANGCSTSVTGIVPVPPTYNPGIVTRTVSCFGLCDGSFTATPTGGIGPYTYILLTGPTTSIIASGTTAVFSSLCAGNYTLLLQDAATPSTCPQSFPVNFLPPAALGVTVDPTDASCFGQCNGAFTTTITGGSGTYTINWVSPLTTTTGANPTGLCAGNYVLSVNDGACTFTTNAVIGEPTQIVLTSSVVTNVTCNGLSNGAISIMPSGGPSASYSYSWSPGTQTTQNVTNLIAGNYSVIVTNSNCSQTFTFDVTQPNTISSSAISGSILCLGACTGTTGITVTSGGTAPYSFMLGAATNTTGNFSGLCSGPFTATITDVNGCTGSATGSIVAPTSSISISAIATRSSCASCSGGATVTATGGTGNLSFAYTNSAGVIPAATASTVGSLCPSQTATDLFTVTVSDQNSCTAVQSFSIPEVIIIITTTSGSVSCAGVSDGTASAVVAGAQGLPTFSWLGTAPVQSGATATGLSAGIYTVQVQDQSTPVACVSSETVEILPVSTVSVSSVIIPPSCANTNDGTITITPAGGPNASYTYTWTSTNTFSSNTKDATGVPSGTYIVAVLSGTGTCTSSFTFVVSSPSLITNVFTVTQPSNCLTPNTGELISTPAGGNGSFGFSWTPGGAITNSITNLSAGNYSLTITSGSCTQQFTADIIAPITPTVSLISSASVACNSGTTGVASFSSTGTGPFQFTWTPTTATTVSGSTITASSLSVGIYTVSAIAANNCVSGPATVSIIQPPALSFTSAITPVICPNGTTGVISLTVSQGTVVSNAYTYSWSNGATTNGSVSTVSNLTATAISGSTYTATVLNPAGCSSSTTMLVPGPATFSFATTSSSIACQGASSGTIGVIATPSTGAIYSWPAVPSTTFAGSTSSVLTGLGPGIYTVNVTNAAGCSATGINTIQISEPSLLTGSVTVTHNVTCFNGTNGSATYSVSGGTAPHTYSWSAGASISTTIGTLSAGIYTAFATDANSCTTQNTFAIIGPLPFTATLTGTNPLCNGAANGSITTQISGNQGAVSYSWSPTGIGQNPTGLNALSIYTLNASDDSLCVLSQTLQLVDPPALMANLSFTNPTCFGNCNGSALSTPSNAVGSTTITWLPSGLTGATIGSLCSNPFNGNVNVYTVNILDGNGCTAVQTFSLNNPSQIITNYTANPALCGAQNGSIAVNVTGGTSPFTYSWSPVAGSNTLLAGLNPGSYTLLAIDNNSCTLTTVIPLTSLNGPTAVATSSNITCDGACTGSITLSNITPSNSAVQWIAPASTTLSGTSFSNLCVGTYSVELTEPVNSCKTYFGFIITSPPPITVSSSSAIPTCFGICDGSISVIPSGGVSGYTVSWNGPSGFTSAATTLTALCGGGYTLSVVDANNCTVTPTFSIPVLQNIVIQQPVTVVNNSCFGDCTGSATINVVSTTTNVLTSTINWSNGQNDSIANNLCSGIYTVSVTDTRGCNNLFTVPIVSPAEITLLAPIVTQPDCNQCNGTAVVTATGGASSTYNYVWSTGATTQSVSSLCGGLYQVEVTDANSCRKLANVVINSLAGFTGDSISVVPENCQSTCSGAATVIGKGGISPITYNWINPALSNTTSTASNLCAGNYFVQMTDANNCVMTSSLAIAPANTISIATFISPPSCGVAPANGSVQIVVSGTTGATTYSWLPGGATTSTLGNLNPGSYTVIVTSDGCSKSAIVNISSLTGPAVTAIQKNIDCNSAAGSISVTSTGTAAMTYSWSSGATGSVVSGLPFGPVTLTITDNNSCSSVQTFSILESPDLELNFNVQMVRCNNFCDGAITLLPVNGSLPYSYTLALPGGSANPSSRTTSLCAGNYTAFVSDLKGCIDTAVVSIINPSAISRTIDTSNSSCSTLSDGGATVTANGGKAPYTYTWTGPASFSATTNTITGLMMGTYSVTVKDSLNCISQISTVSIVPTVTIIANAGSDMTVCPGEEVVLSGTTSIGASSYSWLDNAGTATLSTNSGYSIFAEETQTLQLEAQSSLAGCLDRDTVIINVFAKPFLDAGVASFTIPVYSSTVIGGNPTSLSGGPQHVWAPSEYLDNPFAQNPVTTNTIDVTFTVSIVYGNNCLLSDTVQVKILPAIIVSSGFTPNGDGKNDTWIIDYIDQFPDNTVEIYNRWGEQLFYSKGYFQPFDGTFKGQNLPVGTYYYVIKLNHFAFTKPYTGPITIFR